MLRAWLGSVCIGMGLVVTAAAQSGPLVLVIDEAASHVGIEVGKSGLFSFAGHAHDVVATRLAGQVRIDPADLEHATVVLELAAAGLRVSGKDEPPADVPLVQQVMEGERVLDVARFPVIAFASQRVIVTSRLAASAEVVIDGALTLHGVTRPMAIRASVTIGVGGRLTARGSFVLKQSEFGIAPVTAAGGTIRVKDELDIQFTINTRTHDETHTNR
ncbi:MAG: YceI family protein [Acidobacteriota bacterium]